MNASMAKIDVSDPYLSNPDPSVLNPSKDDTTNLNPSKPDIFKPDPSDPVLLNPTTFVPAPSPPGLGRDVEEPAIALLTEINASLRELKDLSARFMKLVDLPEAEDVGRRTDRNNTRIRSRSIFRGIGSRKTYSASHGKTSDTNEDITEAEEGRRDRRGTTGWDDSDMISVIGYDKKGRRDSRGTTGSDDSDIVAVIGHDTESSEDGTGASTEGALKGYNQLQTKYGDLPHPGLCLQMFNFDARRRISASASWMPDLGSPEEASAWLREKDLVFSRDERCGFMFDTVALATYGNLHQVQYQIADIEAFARDLRKNGGFFFFRERYPRKKNNKIFNGTHVLWCPDRMKEALPMLSAERMHFCEEFSEAGERSWTELSDNRLLDHVLEKRNEAKRAKKIRGPRTTYHYKGMVLIDNGFESPGGRIRQNFVDPHLTGPWQRLW